MMNMYTVQVRQNSSLVDGNLRLLDLGRALREKHRLGDGRGWTTRGHDGSRGLSWRSLRGWLDGWGRLYWCRRSRGRHLWRRRWLWLAWSWSRRRSWGRSRRRRLLARGRSWGRWRSTGGSSRSSRPRASVGGSCCNAFAELKGTRRDIQGFLDVLVASLQDALCDGRILLDLFRIGATTTKVGDGDIDAAGILLSREQTLLSALWNERQGRRDAGLLRVGLCHKGSQEARDQSENAHSGGQKTAAA
ncbi:hypothetical protein BKA81DRAFT_417437 [Phyllosticta paracitricarpa]|uniref:Uncharacterized protein n=1 Tax=Phyllosticta paracitricarpa TaxID=2016321 RepID=A0ABR1N5R1_9PEZI